MTNAEIEDMWPFKVEFWSRDGQQIERCIARAGNLSVGLAAYQSARESYPNNRTTLRNGCHVIRESERDAPLPAGDGDNVVHVPIFRP